MINEREQQQIADAIAAVERRTNAELVTVLVAQSDDYRYVVILWAAVAVVLLTPLLLLLQWSATVVVTSELGAFCALALLLYASGLGMRLVPATVRTFRASNMARRQFLERGLHHTEAETGLLIFVSQAEHYVEILADRGISRHIDQTRWQAIVDRFVSDVRAGRILQGFLVTIEECGDILATACPKTPDNHNELDDRLVLIGYDR